MKFNLRARKIEITPEEIEPGKTYLFVVKDVTGFEDFNMVKKALSEALTAYDVRGVVVTKPITVATVEMLASLEHEQYVTWTHAIVDAWGHVLPAELIESWKLKWVPYSDLSEADKELCRVWARKLVEFDLT